MWITDLLDVEASFERDEESTDAANDAMNTKCQQVTEEMEKAVQNSVAKNRHLFDGLGRIKFISFFFCND